MGEVIRAKCPERAPSTERVLLWIAHRLLMFDYATYSGFVTHCQLRIERNQ